MNNLEKLSSGDIATRNNGTFEQFQEVIGHCFPNDTPRAGGEMEFYEASDSPNGGWVGFNLRKGSTINKPIFDITQLWEELQALKKPEIWWIRVTHQNVETIAKWFGSEIGYEDAIVGCYKHKNGNCVHKGCIPITGVNSYDFGNEIDFATFLKYTGVEPKPTNSGELKNEIVLPEKWGGEIEGLPAPILKRMMECQVEQGNKADHTVFENCKCASKSGRGFDWSVTAEKSAFWTTAITYGDYSRFFEMYPETKPEKVEKSLEMPPQTRTVEQVIYDKLKVILDLNNERINLNVTKGAIELAFYNAKNELEKVESQLTEINTKLSALLK